MSFKSKMTITICSKILVIFVQERTLLQHSVLIQGYSKPTYKISQAVCEFGMAVLVVDD